MMPSKACRGSTIEHSRPAIVPERGGEVKSARKPGALDTWTAATLTVPAICPLVREREPWRRSAHERLPDSRREGPGRHGPRAFRGLRADRGRSDRRRHRRGRPFHGGRGPPSPGGGGGRRDRGGGGDPHARPDRVPRPPGAGRPRLLRPDARAPRRAHLITVRNARTMLDAGYTSAFSAGSPKPRLDVVLKREIEAGRAPGPRLLANGPEITVTGGLGGSNLAPLPVYETPPLSWIPDRPHPPPRLLPPPP